MNHNSTCCDAPLLWEQLGGMLIVREIGGEERYSARCSKCNASSQPFARRVAKKKAGALRQRAAGASGRKAGA